MPIANPNLAYFQAQLTQQQNDLATATANLAANPSSVELQQLVTSLTAQVAGTQNLITHLTNFANSSSSPILSTICNSCSGCNQEMNRQFQGLAAQVKTLSRMQAVHFNLTMIGFIKTIAGLLANGMTVAAALIAADPQVIASMLGSAGLEQLLNMIPSVDFEAALGSITFNNLCLPMFDDVLKGLIANALQGAVDSLNSQLAAAEAAGNAALATQLRAQIACVGVSVNAHAGVSASTNRLSACKTASALVTSAT